MKLLFIVGCLSPGRDGVGDYTRRLAGACIRQGHECRIISLNDKIDGEKQRTENGKLKSETRTLNSNFQRRTAESTSQLSTFNLQLSYFLESQPSEGTQVECLRLPQTLSWPERSAIARDYVTRFNPDWVSLQFVPFGFDPKGLCSGIVKPLQTIIGTTKLQVMFHELWVLWSFPLPLKARVLGQLQKWEMLRLFARLAPNIVHTQLPLYATVLKQHGMNAEVLPLHGNFPMTFNANAVAWLEQKLDRPQLGSFTRIGFFGSMVSTFNMALLLQQIEALQIAPKALLVLSAGKLEGRSNTHWNTLVNSVSKLGGDCCRLGELTEGEASSYFQSLNYGATAYSPELLGKSGSAAAMLEHGLPVLCCGQETHQQAFLSDDRSARNNWSVRDTADSLLTSLDHA